MKHIVYERAAPEVRKMLDRLIRKAEAYQVSMSYSISEGPPRTISVVDNDYFDGHPTVVGRGTVSTVEFDIKCDGLVKADGWTLRAKIEHGENGNIVTTFGGCKARQEWYTLPPDCEHCHKKNFRNVTFIVEHEDGSIRQVGSGCLKNYTGIDPAAVLRWAEVQSCLDLSIDMSRMGEYAYRRSHPVRPAPIRMYDIVDVLAHACDVVTTFGYVKENSGNPRSTCSRVMTRLKSGIQPSSNGLEQAAHIRDWIISLDQVDRDQVAALERRCIPLALSGYAKWNHIKYLAHMPLSYERYLHRKVSGRMA